MNDFYSHIQENKSKWSKLIFIPWATLFSLAVLTVIFDSSLEDESVFGIIFLSVFGFVAIYNLCLTIYLFFKIQKSDDFKKKKTQWFYLLLFFGPAMSLIFGIVVIIQKKKSLF